MSIADAVCTVLQSKIIIVSARVYGLLPHHGTSSRLNHTGIARYYRSMLPPMRRCPIPRPVLTEPGDHNPRKVLEPSGVPFGAFQREFLSPALVQYSSTIWLPHPSNTCSKMGRCSREPSETLDLNSNHFIHEMQEEPPKGGERNPPNLTQTSPLFPYK